ncbi:MAG TPA: hypothetical protein VMN39_05020, partial [Longimicrobiaceae bacterium]|nr:hypothetical protein [Longimicrobiaceae bacterium]
SRNAVPSDFRAIVRLLGERLLNPTDWITHRTSLSRLHDVLPEWLDPASGLVKGMVAVDESDDETSPRAGS